MALFTPTLSTAELDGSNGVRFGSLTITLNGLGFNVDGIDDVNGDGIDDLLLGAMREEAGGRQNRGTVYVVFGQSEPWTASVDLQSLDGNDGFRLTNAANGRCTGVSVAGAGDVNDDGLAEFLIGAERSLVDGVYGTGEAYLVYGRDYDQGDPAFPATLSLDDLGTGVGSRLPGLGGLHFTGFALSGGGDFNGDGIADFVIDGHQADNGSFTGRAYVVFGTAGDLPATFDLAGLDGDNGFQIDGASDDIWLGKSLDVQSDINGDGETYILFGTDEVRPTPADLTVDGSNGFLVAGRNANDEFSRSVSTADFNGDGFADIVIGAAKSDPGGRVDAGEGYVVFGGAGGFPAVLDVRTLAPGQGFFVAGLIAGANLGYTVAGVGVGGVNGDGIDDVAFSAPLATVDGLAEAGAIYVVSGRASVGTSIDLADVDGDDGHVVHGDVAGAQFGGAVSGAGDLNGDGIDDIVASASGNDSAYVIFGRAQTTPVLPSLSIAPTNASRAEGDDGSTGFTFAVTRTGDLGSASSVQWAVSGLAPNAAGAGDFAGGGLPSGQLDFAAGGASRTITVGVAGDTVAEPDEDLRVTLSGAVDATIATATAAGRILDDDSGGGGSVGARLEAEVAELTGGVAASTQHTGWSGDGHADFSRTQLEQ